MKLETIALAAHTLAIASGMSGCGDIQLKSGWYACTTSDDCPRGWQCEPSSG